MYLDLPGVSDVPHTPKSASLKPASEEENVQEVEVKLDSDHDTVSRLKHVEAQLNSLEATARKVRQEIHLDSYKVRMFSGHLYSAGVDVGVKICVCYLVTARYHWMINMTSLLLWF